MPTLENQVKALIDEAESQGIDIIYWLKTQQSHQKNEQTDEQIRSENFAQKEISARF